MPESWLRLFLNQVPPRFDLSDEQVEKLNREGRELLQSNPEIQRAPAALRHSC